MNLYYQIALLVFQEISCILSSIGSLMIISQVCRSRINRTIPQQRLMLGMSISDFAASMNWVFTPLLKPPNPEYDSFTIGNQASCSLQGFTSTLMVTAAVLYQCPLQLQYLLAIKYGWTTQRIQKIEVYMHVIPWCFSLVSAITNLILKNYNPAGWNCWIAPFPSDCTSSLEIRRGGTDMIETNCVRGDNAMVYQLACFYLPLWMVGFFCFFVMFQIYKHVSTTEQRMAKYRHRLLAEDEPKLTLQVKNQALLYAAAFLAVWTFPTITRIILMFRGIHPIMIVFSGALIGSQGIWNAIIYFRPRWKQLDADLNAFQKVMQLIDSTLLFWMCKNTASNEDTGEGKSAEAGEKENTDITSPLLAE